MPPHEISFQQSKDFTLTYPCNHSYKFDRLNGKIKSYSTWQTKLFFDPNFSYEVC